MIAHCGIEVSKRRYEGNSHVVSSPFEGRLLPFLPIMDTLLLRNQQLVANTVQVGEPEQAVHLREVLLLVLGRGGRVDDGGVYDRALAHEQPTLREGGVDFGEQPLGRLTPLQ